MKTLLTTFMLAFCFSVNIWSQSIFELSKNISFYSSECDLSIEKVSDTNTIQKNGSIIYYKNYQIAGSESYNSFEFIENDEDVGLTVYRVESIPKHEEIKIKKRDTDTLFIVLDTAYGIFGPDIYIDQETNYGGVAIPAWINDTLGYVSNLDHGVLNIAAILEVGAYVNLVFRENYEFDGQDTVFLSASEAIHQIDYVPLDENGTYLGDINFGAYVINKFSLAFDLSNGGLATMNFEIFETVKIFVSDYHGEIDMFLASELEYPFTGYNYKSYFIEYPEQDSITQPITLTNEPGDLATAVLNYSYYDKRDFDKIGLGDFMKFCSPFTGQPTIWGSISYSQQPAHKTWKGSWYMDMQDSDKFGFCKQHYMKCDNNPYIASPYFDEHNDSIAGFRGFTPEADIHYINDYDTLFFGKGLSFYWPIWTVSHSHISCTSDNMGLFGNYFYRDYVTDIYKIMDDAGNIINEGSGLEIACNLPELGQYTIQQKNTFCPFNGYIGSSTLNSTTFTSKTDRNPPPISQIQLINENNTMKYHFEIGEDIFLKFSSSDFIYYNDNHIGTNFQAIVDSVTNVSIKQHNHSEWIKADCEKIYSDSIIGFQYQAELSEYLVNDSAMYDLKIYVIDYSGNSSELTFSPAFIYGNFTVGLPDNLDGNNLNEIITFSPNPANDYVSISHVEALNGASVTYEIINTNGSVVKKGLIPQNTLNPTIEISDLTIGLYIITLSSMKKPIISMKIIKM